MIDCIAFTQTQSMGATEIKQALHKVVKELPYLKNVVFDEFQVSSDEIRRIM